MISACEEKDCSGLRVSHLQTVVWFGSARDAKQFERGFAFRYRARRVQGRQRLPEQPACLVAGVVGLVEALHDARAPRRDEPVLGRYEERIEQEQADEGE